MDKIFLVCCAAVGSILAFFIALSVFGTKGGILVMGVLVLFLLAYVIKNMYGDDSLKESTRKRAGKA